MKKLLIKDKYTGVFDEHLADNADADATMRKLLGAWMNPDDRIEVRPVNETKTRYFILTDEHEPIDIYGEILNTNGGANGL